MPPPLRTAAHQQPRIFLFDEALSNLDAALRVQTRIAFSRLHKDVNATMIYVTYHLVEAMTLADRIVVMRAETAKGREGIFQAELDSSLAKLAGFCLASLYLFGSRRVRH